MQRHRDARVLPADGRDEPAPPFTLPDVTPREREVWEELWRTPQAAAWAREPWRRRAVELYTRWSVRLEDHDASAALGNVVVRFADQLGLTPAGLVENGWRIEHRAPRSTQASAERPRSRFRVVQPDESATAPADDDTDEET